MRTLSKIAALRFDATQSQQAFYAKIKGLAKTKHEQTNFILQQLALNTFGTIIEGSPALIGYFKNSGNTNEKNKLRYPDNHAAMAWLDTGINQIAFDVADKKATSQHVLDLREYLLSLPLDITEGAFIESLDVALSLINPKPEAKPKQAKPKVNALNDAVALVIADIAKLTAKQKAQLIDALAIKETATA